MTFGLEHSNDTPRFSVARWLYISQRFPEFNPMDRKVLQSLSLLRIREAEALLSAQYFSGAYYLAGYSVECGIKACK